MRMAKDTAKLIATVAMNKSVTRIAYCLSRAGCWTISLIQETIRIRHAGV